MDTYQLSPYIKLKHELVGARWDETAGKWRLDIKRPKDASASGTAANSDETEVFEDTAELLFTGVGALSRWDWPDIEGLQSFKGTLVHSAKWEVSTNDEISPNTPTVRKHWEEDVKDWGDKRVAVIGVVSQNIFNQ